MKIDIMPVDEDAQIIKYDNAYEIAVINVNSGVYDFTGFSGTGKTYLNNVLKRNMVYDDSCMAITYNDIVGKNNIADILLNKLKNNQYKVIMLDRYDLYADKIDLKELREHNKDAVILVDTKLPRDEIDDTVMVMKGNRFLGVRL